MEIREIKFAGSSTDLKGCPKPIFPEYAFTGRSNVGKSSLINFITGRKKLAYTSSSPGKTQLINHFLVDERWYLADLPGYGYARTSKKNRHNWTQMIYKYITGRENLMSLFVLMDARHPALENDMEFINMLGHEGIPFVIVLTKTDKISTTDLQKNRKIFEQEMLRTWEELPHVFSTSVLKKRGREEILGFIEQTNALFKKSE